MISKYRKLGVAVASAMLGAAIAFVPTAAQAGTQDIGGGWTASWDSSFDGNLSLDVLQTTDDSVFLKKTVTFSNLGTVPDVPITFQQNGSTNTPAAFIVFDEEDVTNNSGLPWDGFRFLVTGGSTATSSQFDVTQTAIGTSGGFSINPFTVGTYSDVSGVPNTQLDLSGGIVDAGAHFTPGKDSGALYVQTGDSSVFTFKETPHAIPLPAAFWAGLWSLSGLGVLGLLRRRVMA